MNTSRKSDGTELPDGWRLMRLGDVAEVVTGSTPPRKVSEYYGGNVPWIKPSDLASARIVDSSEEYLTSAGVAASRQVPELSVLVSCIGTIGEVGISRVPLCFNQQINALIPCSEVLPAFLYWACNQQANYLISIAAKTAVPILNKTAFSNVSILLPPLPEQRAIADVLDSIDEVIEHTEVVIAATETLRDSLLHELLTRGVPGWHTEWKDVPGIGTIPANWEVVRLGEVIESSTYGTNEPLGDNGNIIVLRMNNIQRGEIDWSEVKQAELSERELNELDLRPGDILFNRTNSLDLVGKIAMVRDLPELTSFASYLVRIRTKAKRTSLFTPVFGQYERHSNPVLPVQRGNVKLPNLQVLNAILYVAEQGSFAGDRKAWVQPPRDLPMRYQSRIPAGRANTRRPTPGVSQANINPTSLKSLTIPLPSSPVWLSALNQANAIRLYCRQRNPGNKYNTPGVSTKLSNKQNPHSPTRC